MRLLAPVIENPSFNATVGNIRNFFLPMKPGDLADRGNPAGHSGSAQRSECRMDGKDQRLTAWRTVTGRPGPSAKRFECPRLCRFLGRRDDEIVHGLWRPASEKPAHKPTSDQIDPTTICHKCRTRETQFAGEEGDAFGSFGALIARPPNPPSASEQARHSVGVGGNLSWDCALTRANAPRERGVPKRS
jgi:hypothetical protein